MKRIMVATMFGLIAGVICASLLSAAHILKLTTVTLVWILLNRAVMGFAIGASGLRLHWAWNGAVMGLVVGSIFSYYLFMNVGFGMMPLANLLVGNPIFGLMIEFFTSVVFKQTAVAASRERQASVAAA